MRNMALPIDRPAAIPVKLLLIPTILGIIASGATAKIAHGNLGAPTPLLVACIGVVFAATMIELVAVPVSIRRLIATPPLRSVGNVLAVALAGLFLALQLLLLLL